MKKIIILTLSFIVFFSAGAFAQTAIKAEVDQTKITTDDNLTYKIVVTSSEKKLPLPQMPKFEGFQVISSAQSSTLSFFKSEIKTILVYAYILAPINTGKFKIEVSTIKIKDKTYSTDTFEIEVTPGKAKPKVLPEKKLPLPKKPQPESEEPQFTL